MNYRKLSSTFLLYILSFLFWLNVVHGQGVIPKRYLSGQDKEKMEQADQINQEASALFSEAEAFYSDLEKIKKGGNPSNKRIRRLREWALKKDIEGFEKKKRANQLIYKIYKKHYNTFETTESNETTGVLLAHLKYEQAGRFFYRAAILRNEAYNHVEDLEGKFSKLGKAQHIEEQGLKALGKALEHLYEKKMQALGSGFRSASPDERVIVNESLLREIKRALNQYEYENSIYSELTRIRKNDTVSFNTIRDIIIQYRGRQGSSYDSLTKQGTMNEAGLTDNTGINPDRSPEGKRDQRISEENKDSSSIIASLNFRVQIATDRNSLSQGELRKLYSGNKKIYSIREGGWQKYLIGQFPSYRDACRFRKEIELKDAYIVAFNGEESVSPGEILQAEATSVGRSKKKGSWKSGPPQSGGKNKEVSYVEKESIDSGSTVVFRVQIAADRIRIEPDQLHSIYSGIKKIHLNKAEGWYRYAVGTCRTYDQARRLRRHIPVKGSWIVAYKEGKRYNGYRMQEEHPSYPAPRIRKKIAQQEGILFKVQIAASRVPMSSSELKHIYCGKKVVTEIQHDKYYKYSIGGYDNYKDASRLKKNLCVPGAFVVAFKQGRPLDIQKAISQNK